MCGIVGYFSTTTVASERIIARMADRIAHRGPDACGTWVDANKGVAFAHQRLAIVDQSNAGIQPMQSQNQRFIIVFNGEIYNHISLRNDIISAGGPYSWRGHSDTETLLAALQLWGLVDTLKRLKGMFAFALWDQKTDRLFLARDRIGEKPLYFGKAGKSFVFGSELKALKTHPEWVGEIDQTALILYLRHGYIPDPHCIYQGMNKLKPGHWIEVVDGISGEPNCYWDFNAIAASKRTTSKPLVLIDELEQRLKTSVALQMQSDVPIGTFLSGGVDSSLVASLMQAQASQPIKSFTIGFEAKNFDEANEAKAIARYLGTDHTELILTEEDAFEVIPKLGKVWDEPFSDSSQIPTLLLSQMARNHVKVALTGDGADEFFCGYSRYQHNRTLLNILEYIPISARRRLASGLRDLTFSREEELDKQHLPKFLACKSRDKIHRALDILELPKKDINYMDLISLFPNPNSFIFCQPEGMASQNTHIALTKFQDVRETMMFMDTCTYLPGDILTKVDRSAMSVGLETRLPFLDHELIEYAWRLPFHVKVKNGQPKWILREVLKKYLPLGLFDRPKKGFSVPIEAWLAGPLLDWVEAMLDPHKIRQQGFLNAEAVGDLLRQHRSGQRRWHNQIWTILMFQAWLENEHIVEKTP